MSEKFICPICGEELKVMAAHSSGENGQDEIIGYRIQCDNCNRYFEDTGGERPLLFYYRQYLETIYEREYKAAHLIQIRSIAQELSTLNENLFVIINCIYEEIK